MTSGQPVREELKRAWPAYIIDFSRPALKPMIRAIVGNLRKECELYQPPEGIRIRKVKTEPSGREPVRCYVIEPEDSKIRPAMLFCHGGGFFLPVQASTLALAAAYVQKTGVRIFVPEYGLLPEHRGAEAFWDCMSVWEDMWNNAADYAVDTPHCLLYGESAGGALAAGIALKCRDDDWFRAAAMLLVYPVLDDRSGRYASMDLYSDAPWSKKSNIYMWQQYLRDGTESLREYLVPMRNEDLSGLPPIYIEPQEIDTLRDEACAFAERVASAGVSVTLNLQEGSFHGFDSDTENEFVRNVIAERTRFMDPFANGQRSGSLVNGLPGSGRQDAGGGKV